MASKINAKKKGNSFEREIANKLSERFEQKTGIEKSFRRNPDSGSFGGGTNKKRLETHDVDNMNFGDIIAPNDFRFTIECKNYKTSPLMIAILKQKIKDWDDWIEQAEDDGNSCNKLPIIIIKYNNVPTICLLKEKIETVSYIKYKEYNVYDIDDILKLDDDFFFV